MPAAPVPVAPVPAALAPVVPARYGAGAATCYALRPAAAESIAARVAWYGLFAGPVSGSLAMGVAAYAASLILPPTSPLPPDAQARLTAALQERDLGSLAGARHLPPETVAHLWHEALAPFLEDEACDATACGPFAPAVAQIQRRPAARDALRRAVAELGGGEGFEGVALALVAAERCVDGDAQRCADVAWALGKAAPVAAPIIKRRATSVPTFAPAATYVGRRPGYKFTAGARGVGGSLQPQLSITCGTSISSSCRSLHGAASHAARAPDVVKQRAGARAAAREEEGRRVDLLALVAREIIVA